MPFSAFVIPGFLFHVIIVSTSRRRNGCTFAIAVTNLPTVSSQGVEQRLVVAGRNHGRRGFQQLRFVPSRLLTGLRFQRCQSNDPQKQKHCSFQIRKLNRKELRDCIFFFSPLFLQPSLVQTVLLVSLQVNEEHEGQKSQVLTGVEEVDWREVGRPGLRPGLGSSWDDWPYRCKHLGSLRREGWLQNWSWLHVWGWRSSVQ